MSAQRAVLFYVLCLGLVWALIPTLTFPNPPLDVVEGFAWGRELALGYTKHPPMQAWLLELSYHLTGGADFGGYWLSQIAIGLGYWCIWELAKRLGLSDWQAFWSVVLTSVTFYFTLPAPEFNPNILQIPVWAGMTLFFNRALEKGRLFDWALLGAIAAFGLYSKYFTTLLIGTIGLYVLVVPSARKCLTTAGPWLAATVCIALLTPHILWLVDNDFLTFAYAASRSRGAENVLAHLTNPASFLGAQIVNHAGLFIVILAGLGITGMKAFPGRLRHITPPDQHVFLLWFAFVPLGVVLLTSAVTGNEFKHMWGTSLFVLSGIVTVRFLNLPDSWPSPKHALIAALVVQSIFLSIMLGQALLEPLWKTKHTRIHYPSQEIAQTLSKAWKDTVGTDLAYVAGDMWPTANVTLHSANRPSMFLQHDQILSPWIDIKDVQQKGVMLIWPGDNNILPENLARLYPDAKRDGSLSLPSHPYGTIPPIMLNWTIIPPGHIAENAVSE